LAVVVRRQLAQITPTETLVKILSLMLRLLGRLLVALLLMAVGVVVVLAIMVLPVVLVGVLEITLKQVVPERLGKEILAVRHMEMAIPLAVVGVAQAL